MISEDLKSLITEFNIQEYQTFEVPVYSTKSTHQYYWHERDEVKPTVDAIKRLADNLDTTVGFLLGENEPQRSNHAQET